MNEAFQNILESDPPELIHSDSKMFPEIHMTHDSGYSSAENAASSHFPLESAVAPEEAPAYITPSDHKTASQLIKVLDEVKGNLNPEEELSVFKLQRKIDELRSSAIKQGEELAASKMVLHNTQKMLNIAYQKMSRDRIAKSLAHQVMGTYFDLFQKQNESFIRRIHMEVHLNNRMQVPREELSSEQPKGYLKRKATEDDEIEYHEMVMKERELHDAKQEDFNSMRETLVNAIESYLARQDENYLLELPPAKRNRAI
ncbi:hypothetical protein Dda_7014 [Drechslerella dactyloides]|uniref:Uncharacterized protein n=1 Tax=Drechslerella dactyloides TaxID=74499 RepID=A0AAD6NH59_DREDA|nr:hypothetical protein Dda_7014 [Drechslerella dactyloides]